MQRTRAGAAANGSYVSSHLLIRDGNGDPIGCADGTLSATVSVSTTGESGPFEPVTGEVQIRCPDGPGGDLAVVLDNSGSTSDVVSTLRGASALLVDEVVDAGGHASLTRVSTNASVLHDLSDDGESLVQTIVDGLHNGSNGWTALWDGVRMGNETFGGAVVHESGQVGWESLDAFCGASDRLGILAFTDGHENNSADQQDYDHDRYPGDGLDTTVEDLINLHVAGQTTPIYTVALGDEPDHDVLSDIATRTGGTHSAISEVSEILDVFDTIGDYFGSTHQVCAELPEPVCGTTWIQLEWTLTDDQGAVLDSGVDMQSATVDCPSAPPVGRAATLLLTLTNPYLPPDEVDLLVRNTAEWTANRPDPRFLVVLDDNHHNEFIGDAPAIRNMLDGAGYQVDLIDEPSDGLEPEDLDGYDVVWLSNPGYPPDDLSTISALAAFNAAGGGLVIQGDDMTRAHGNAFSMEPLTGLSYENNGVRTCGVKTDNNNGERFLVELDDPHPLLAGISPSDWYYGDDIDHNTALAGTTVIAEATLATDPGCTWRPTMTVRDPNTP